MALFILTCIVPDQSAALRSSLSRRAGNSASRHTIPPGKPMFHHSHRHYRTNRACRRNAVPHPVLDAAAERGAQLAPLAQMSQKSSPARRGSREALVAGICRDPRTELRGRHRYTGHFDGHPCGHAPPQTGMRLSLQSKVLLFCRWYSPTRRGEGQGCCSWKVGKFRGGAWVKSISSEL